ncbi:MAG: hypothetical protein ABI026_07335 [Gemmatimonadaceae bacterium]
MTTDQGTKRRFMALAPIPIVMLAIGARYAFESTGLPRLAGWAIVIGSLMTLAGYALAIRRAH